MKFIGVVTTLLLVCLAASVHAKCSQERYEVEGQVVDSESKKVVSDARVFIFLDDEQSPNPAGYSTMKVDFFRTDDTGHYLGTAFFDTYSGRSWKLTDACNGAPKKIQIFVVADNYHSFRFTANVKDLEKEAGKQRLVIPPILLPKVITQQKDR